MAAFETDLGDTPTPEVEDVSTLDAPSLLRQYAAVERELRDRLELHRSHTDAGRELHSRRTAYLLELRHRRLM